ncbi:hypothetical protein [Paraclostridium bifermentans]|uniref:hypothetical protein n=1 Tax=Paraclostridium bifermentans TaxID=1490 RepID=UPI00359C2CAC
MNKKNLFNAIIFCGILLWIIPSAIFHEADKKIVLFYYGFHFIMAMLYLYLFLSAIREKRNIRYENILKYLSIEGSIAVHAITYAALFIKGQESDIKIIPLVLIFRLIFIIFIIASRNMYIDSNEKILKKIKLKEKLYIKDNKSKEKAVIKKSNKWVYKILLEDFKVNIKNYIAFIISSILTVTCVYGFLGNLFIIHRIQQTRTMYLGEGITSIVVSALVIITIINILIQFYALKSYIQNRMYDFKTLILLGMKKKKVNQIIVFLITISLATSYLIGVILGNMMIFIFRKIYGFYLQTDSIPSVNVISVMMWSFIICVLVLGFIMAIVQEIAIESSILNGIDSDLEEKLPRHRKLIYALPIFIIILTVLYSNPHIAEKQYIIYMFLIIFTVFIYFFIGDILRKYKSKKKYYFKKFLTWNLIIYKSRSYLKNSLILYSLLFIMFYVYFFQISTLIPLNTDTLYPYDYVCLGYDKDKTELQSIGNNFEAESKLYPVVRVTVPGGEDGGYGDFFKTLPIGHHLGISESTYKLLTGKKLDLKDKEIYILYQEDKSNKAHPLDFYVIRSKPLIRIGQPQSYNPGYRKSFFSNDYNLVGEKREIVFGRLSNIMYENIVVFSDEYFEIEHEKTDGIKWLSTINSKIKNNKNLDTYLENYKNTHTEEQTVDGNIQSVYESKNLKEAFQGEKIFKLIINISICIIFTIAGIMTILVYVFGNISYYKNRYEILSYLGEKRKNSNNIIRKEIRLFSLIPCILAIITSFIFIVITVKIRGFNYFELISSSKVYISIMLVFLFIYAVSIFIISRFLIKEIGGK